MFSWLKPIILNIKNGKHKDINKNNFKLKLEKIRFNKQKIKTIQTRLKIATL